MAAVWLVVAVCGLVCFSAVHGLCGIGPECESDERCSSFDLKCYRVFNMSDYAEITVWTGAAFGGPYTDVSSSFNESLGSVLDNNASTGISLDANTIYLISAVLKGNFWVHSMEMTLVGQEFFSMYTDGSLTDTTVLSNSVEFDDVFPRRVRNFSLEVFGYEGVSLIEIIISGAFDTPMPSASPSATPTQSSEAPSKTPSKTPSGVPTPAPSGYPTPDVCDELLITQSCCGNNGYQIEDDRVNLRDSSLTSCERTFPAPCCGTLGGTNIGGGGTKYGCDGSQADSISDGAFSEVLCDPSFFDTSVNASDDIVGTVIAGENTMFNSTNAGPVTSEWCTCAFTAYECEGDDVAMCGTADTWDAMFSESCWGNDTEWSEYDDFTNETCWKEIVEETSSIEHLLWEPCSVESFVGNVTAIQAVSSEFVFEEECSCEYMVLDCQLLEDPSKTQCDPEVDCANGGECLQQLAAPCCGYESYDEMDYEGLNVSVWENQVPVEWTCANDAAELCPDRFEGSRVFTAESRVDWWWDGMEEVIKERCGCLYVTDECNLPSESPTINPTEAPTNMPTVAPEEDDSGVHGLPVNAAFVVVSVAVVAFVR